MTPKPEDLPWSKHPDTEPAQQWEDVDEDTLGVTSGHRLPEPTHEVFTNGQWHPCYCVRRYDHEERS